MAKQNTQTATLPLFYQNPVAINQEQHGSLALNMPGDYKFTAKTNSIPVNLIEFGNLIKHYPIVFIKDSENKISPVVVLGYKAGENLFVDSKGQWEEGTYIPAYVRRYPFIFANDSSSDRLTLCIDQPDKHLSSKGKEKLFSGKDPAALTQNALDFCSSFHQAHAVTEKFCAELLEQDVLMEQQANITSEGKNVVSLSGFLIVNEDKLANLDPQLLSAWISNGYLKLISAHLLSQHRWSDLTQRLGQKQSKPAAKKKTDTKKAPTKKAPAKKPAAKKKK